MEFTDGWDGSRREPERSTPITFGEPTTGQGIRIHDRVERRQFELHAPDPVSPTRASTDGFIAPVDAAVHFAARSLSYDDTVALYVRDETGELLDVAEKEMCRSYPDDAYLLELNPPIKVYIRIDGELAIRSDADRTVLEFGDRTDVFLGARSFHERPAATIETSSDPTDMMAALSTLGSALKTTSPERAYPTLRGHPPEIVLGDQLAIPDSLETPDTGVTIEVPTDESVMFEVAPLAFYLGATITEGHQPRIVTDSGFTHTLDEEAEPWRQVRRTLGQQLLLDCILRTEGLYTIDLYEREEFEKRVDLDVAELYHQPLARRLETTLSIPYDTVADLIPTWKLTAYVPRTTPTVELLPYLLHELAIVRTLDPEEIARAEGDTRSVSGFQPVERVQDTKPVPRKPGSDGIERDPDSSLEHAWFAEGAPAWATKATRQAYRNGLGRTLSEDISIAVVQNDARMDAERETVERIYEPQRRLPFDVSLHRQVSTADLRAILESDLDFLHYIGHVDTAGFECVDGFLSVGDLESVGVDAFLLNACQSYELGLDLIDAGAIGGVVTVNDVVNSAAIEVGQSLARLLHRGFPLSPAVDLAREETVLGSQYLVVGDGDLTVSQSKSGSVFVGHFEPKAEGFDVVLAMYPTSQKGLGSLFMPTFEQEYRHYLNAGEVGPIHVPTEEAADLLAEEDAPILVDGALRWSSEVDVGDLR